MFLYYCFFGGFFFYQFASLKFSYCRYKFCIIHHSVIVVFHCDIQRFSDVVEVSDFVLPVPFIFFQ